MPDGRAYFLQMQSKCKGEKAVYRFLSKNKIIWGFQVDENMIK